VARLKAYKNKVTPAGDIIISMIREKKDGEQGKDHEKDRNMLVSQKKIIGSEQSAQSGRI
jgi:hypothetical protein